MDILKVEPMGFPIELDVNNKICNWIRYEMRGKGSKVTPKSWT